MPRTFGLIDGNSFYCSCERAFSPRLRGQAVVLSNNDSCAVARTSEGTVNLYGCGREDARGLGWAR